MQNINKITAILTTPVAFTINIDEWINGAQTISPLLTLIISLLSITSLILVIKNNIAKGRDNKVLSKIHEIELQEKTR